MMQLKVVCRFGRSLLRRGALNQLVSKICESSESGKSGKVNEGLIVNAGLCHDKYHNLKDFLGGELTLATARPAAISGTIGLALA
jgi:hypothetical protein